MKKLLILCLLLTAFLSPLTAQFTNGAYVTSEPDLIHRAWHLSSKKAGNFLLARGAGGFQLGAVNNTINAQSTFVIEPGPDDGDWTTADKRWFLIRCEGTNLYLTVSNTTPGSPITLSSKLDNDLQRQQFRIINSVPLNWKKLRSHMSTTNNNLVLEINDNGQLIIDNPKIDPSEEQKFAFNLAMPTNSQVPYVLIGFDSKTMMTNMGIKTPGQIVTATNKSNLSCLWYLKPVGGGYYHIENALTQTRLMINEVLPGLFDVQNVKTSTLIGAKAEWELVREDNFFVLRNRFFDRVISGYEDIVLHETYLSSGIRRKWIVALADQPEAQPIAAPLDKIIDAPQPAGCLTAFGSQFKKALAERVGLPAEEQYFPILQAAVEQRYGPGSSTDILSRFDLNNPGHRVDLTLMLRKYILEVLPSKAAVGTLTPVESQTLAYLNSVISQLRLQYASDLVNAWTNFVQSGYNPNGGLSTLIENLLAENFVWPVRQDLPASHIGLWQDYVNGATFFQEANPIAVGQLSSVLAPVVSIGVGVSLQVFVFGKLSAEAVLGSISLNTASALGTGGTKALASFIQGAGGVVTVVVIAAQIIAGEAQEHEDLQDLINEIGQVYIWASTPVNIPAIMIGDDLLDQIRLFDDIDFVMGAPTANGFFIHNTNDNFYQPAFTLSCVPSVTLDMNSTGDATLTASQVVSGIIQLCGSEITYNLSQNQFDCNDIPSVQVTLMAQNDKGAQSCNVTVNLRDNTPPTVTCPAAQTLTLGANCTAVLPDYRYLATHLTDNCDIDMATQSPPAGTVVSGAGDMTITFTVTDVSGNSTQCSFTLTKVDNTPPTIVCPPTQTLVLGSACSATLPNYTSLATANDNCGVQSVTQSPAAGTTVSNAGNMNVTLTVTDINGNTNNCTFTVTKVDNTPPSILCPPTQTLVLGNTCSANLPDYRSLATTNDNCGVQSVMQSPAAGTLVSGAGNMSVTITATDINGNTNTCTFTVTKVDNTAPTVQCFNQTITFNGQTNIALNDDDLVDASDNCGVASISLSPDHITCEQVGQTVPVTVTVTDVNNNVSTCTSYITVTGLPCGWSQNPNGVGCTGGSSNTYNPATGVWTATSTNCFYGPPYTSDATSLAQRSLCGDGSVTVQVTGINGSGWAGVVMRESSAPGAKKVQLLSNMGQFHRREIRTANNSAAQSQQSTSNNRHWLRITRLGNQFAMFASANGSTWFLIGAQTIAMNNCIEMGLIATNYTANSTVTATFAGVSFTGSNNSLGSPLTPHSLTPHSLTPHSGVAQKNLTEKGVKE